MKEGQGKQNDLVDTTDCLESVGVFRGWKNFLFVIILLCLLLLQAAFWLVDTGYVKAACDEMTEEPAVVTEEEEKPAGPIIPDVNDPNAFAMTAEPADDEPTEPADAPPPAPKTTTKQKLLSIPRISLETLVRIVRAVDYLLVLAAILYCLTMLFSLKVSLVGRLGGISHICRAFFLSLVFVVLLLPWQKYFSGIVAGAIYTPTELKLLSSSITAEDDSVLHMVLHYLRFTGYWLLVLLLLILAQLRSGRWTRGILRRLEVI